VAEKHPVAEAIRTEIIKIATEGDSKQDGTLTVDVLLRIVRVAKTGRDLLAAMVESPKNLASLVKRPQSPFGYIGMGQNVDGDLDGISGESQMASPVFATAPMSENFGMTAMREIIAAAKNFNGNGTSPARLVEAIAIAKEKGLDDVARELEEQLGIKKKVVTAAPVAVPAATEPQKEASAA
jgi:hypothetical protein